MPRQLSKRTDFGSEVTPDSSKMIPAEVAPYLSKKFDDASEVASRSSKNIDFGSEVTPDSSKMIPVEAVPHLSKKFDYASEVVSSLSKDIESEMAPDAACLSDKIDFESEKRKFLEDGDVIFRPDFNFLLLFCRMLERKFISWMRQREIRICFLKVLRSEVILFYIFENYFILRNFFFRDSKKERVGP